MFVGGNESRKEWVLLQVVSFCVAALGKSVRNWRKCQLYKNIRFHVISLRY
jgi:hypothetical protein